MSTTIEYKIGDVARLISGGPKMTIVSVDFKYYKCQWFDKQDIVHVADFIKATLVLDKPE